MKKIYLLLILVFCVNISMAQNNGTCSNATVISPDNTYIGHTNSDTSNISGCWNNNCTNQTNSSWFTFTIFNTFYGNNTFFDISLNAVSLPHGANWTLFQGSCNNLTELYCHSADTSNLNSFVSRVNMPNGKYYILVDGYCADTGSFTLSVNYTPPGSGTWGTSFETAARVFPGGDNCELATSDQIPVNSTYTVSAADDGTADDPIPSCWTSNSNKCAQWFVFTSNDTTAIISPQSYNFSGKVIWEDGTLYGYADLALFEYENHTLTEKGCTTRIPVSSGKWVVNQLKIGTEYYVMMDTSGVNTNCTYGSLCVKSRGYNYPFNNRCSDAQQIAVNTYYKYSTYGATPDGTLCSGSTENNVWAKFVAPYNGYYYVSISEQECNGSRGVQPSIYKSDICPPSTATCIATSNTQGTGLGAIYLSINQTLIINVDGFGGIDCNFSLIVFDSTIFQTGTTLALDTFPSNLTINGIAYPTFSTKNTSGVKIWMNGNSVLVTEGMQEVSITDMLGRTETLSKMHTLEGMDYYSANHLAKGVYVITVEHNGQITTRQKIVIQ